MVFHPALVRAPTNYFREEPDGVTLFVKAQPRANTNEIVGVHGTELRVKITAPPVDSAANEALVRFLAEELGVAKNQVQLVRGASARHKAIKVIGLKAEEVKRRLGL
jgi:uncharacterized protein (TIGR00251 family)